MDSGTQFLLGASIAGAMMGGKLGGRALLIGGVVATLPDLDAFLPYGNAIDTMTYHRGFSHSVLVQTAVAPVIAYAVSRVVPVTRAYGKLLLLTVWLCLVTHSMLDSLTTYGTQILWPLEIGPPVAFPAVFIIDPVYTGLLLVGVLVLWLLRRNRPLGLRANRIVLVLSTLYLGLGVTGHTIVRARAEVHPDFVDTRLHVQPAPFSILFWQVLGTGDRHTISGLTSLLGTCPISQITRGTRHAQPPEGFVPSASVRRLEWFTDGFYSYGNHGDTVTITDLRIGFDPAYVFSFTVAQRASESYEALEPTPAVPGPFATDRFAALFGKIGATLDACANSR